MPAQLELWILRILATLVALLMAGSVGGYYGYKYAKDADAAASLVAAKQAIEQSNADVKAAADAYYQAGLRNATIAARSNQLALEGQLDAAKKSKPECAWDSQSFGMLQHAVDTANGEGGSPATVPSGMQPVAPTGGAFGLGHPFLGLHFSGGSGALPEPAQPVRGGTLGNGGS